MCTLGVANSILKQHGVEFVTEHVLRLLMPLLTAQQLNVQQFAKYMLFVKDILRKIEEKRGVILTDSGMPEVKSSVPSNGSRFQSTNKHIGPLPSTKSSPAWDEDWGPTARGTNTQQISTNIPPALSTQSNQMQATASTKTSNQPAISCTPVDIEWPPRSSSGVTSQLGDSVKQPVAGGPSTSSSFGDVDPFANWPTRPSSLSSASKTSSNGSMGRSVNNSESNTSATRPIDLDFPSSSSMNWTLNNQSSSEQKSWNQGNSAINSSNPASGAFSSQNSIRMQKQNHEVVSSLSNYAEKTSTDRRSLGALKLAPPPSTAVGRGRGRERISSARPNSAKSPSEQPPLLDLL